MVADLLKEAKPLYYEVTMTLEENRLPRKGNLDAPTGIMAVLRTCQFSVLDLSRVELDLRRPMTSAESQFARLSSISHEANDRYSAGRKDRVILSEGSQRNVQSVPADRLRFFGHPRRMPSE